MFILCIGCWLSIYWFYDVIWMLILLLDGYGVYVILIMVFVFYFLYKLFCIEVIFCILEILLKELVFFINLFINKYICYLFIK